MLHQLQKQKDKRSSHVTSKRFINAHVQTQTQNDCKKCDELQMDIDKLITEVESRPPLEPSGTKCNSKLTDIDLMKEKAYSDETVKCVLHLLAENVGYSHVGPVIKAVLNLVGLQPKALPSVATVAEMAKKRAPLNSMFVAHQLSETMDTTLYSDETSKFGQRVQNYIVTDADDNTILIGMREMADKSANSVLSTLKEILSDLDSVTDVTNTGKKIVTSIKNTMSDRAATEKSFNSLLKHYRTALLSEIIPGWHVLSKREQESLGNMHNFYCGLHLLVNLADQSASTLSQYEAKIAKSSRSESEVVNLIRMCCKAFSRGGDEKSGCYELMTLFLESRGVNNKLTNFRGNRFNILFHNAAVVYYLHKHFVSFFDTVNAGSNLLLASIKQSLHNSLNLAGCRALGLISKFITTPLWNILEGRDHSVLDMSRIYTTLIHNMQTLNYTQFILGQCNLFMANNDRDSDSGNKRQTADNDDGGPDDTTVPKQTDDVVVTELTKSGDSDADTEHILEFLIPDLTTLLQRLLTDQLPGGEHAANTNLTHPECKSVIKHNKLPETVFAQLDYLQHTKPSSSIFSQEAHIMFNFNKVSSWISAMSDQEWTTVLGHASKLYQTTYANFITCKNDIKQAKHEKLRQTQEQMEKKKQKKLKRTCTTYPRNIL
ncbi:uncharacterized protein LOC124274447 [Haliotis rubra]|uniref:uncharacterized protein LOC124274447 n=1 Tax=Haliotis rubra TaxID=36100 RepID=UPI001EE6323B|nr:uncharacterized protein LOC124274447 [Haliotis rubra]